MIGLDEQIFYSHNRNDEPSETEHAEMRFNLASLHIKRNLDFDSVQIEI